MVVESGNAVAAVGVEKIVGTRSLLVHSLSPIAAAEPIISGGTLDATGNPLFGLTPAGLVQVVQLGHGTMASPGEARRLPILIIDDSLTTRMVEQNVLESAGHHVETATSGEEALEMAHAHRYGLFLVDIESPRYGWFPVSGEGAVVGSPAMRDPVPILVSSRNSVEDRQRAEEAGARAYIAKGDFHQGNFLATVTALLE